jgi:hypothetical protein
MVTGLLVQTTGSFVSALLVAAVISAAGALIYLFGVRSPIALEAGDVAEQPGQWPALRNEAHEGG